MNLNSSFIDPIKRDLLCSIHSMNTISDFANTLEILSERFRFYNYHLAVLLKERGSSNSKAIFKRATDFLNCPLKIDSQVNIDLNQFTEELSQLVKSYNDFKCVFSKMYDSPNFLKKFIFECENLKNYSAGHEKLFDEILGFSSVEDIENKIQKILGQRPWEGAFEGRYAYSSSLSRIKDFFDAVSPKSGQMVYDLGSGYGQVLFFGAVKYPEVKFRGVEFIKERVDLAEMTRTKFALNNISFFADDARQFDFLDGDIFYLYSPFALELKIEIFQRFVELGKRKHIKLYVYDTDRLEIFENRSDVFSKREHLFGNLFVS